LEDIFDIQEKVSRSIVDTLQMKLNTDEDQKITKRPIKNVQAYECYLRARQESWLLTPDALERALHYLQNGLDIIGENALLYAGLGYVYCQYVNIGIGPDTLIDQAEVYAKKALELDSESSEAQLVIGFLSSAAFANPKKAIKCFRQVLAQNPHDTHAIQWLSEELLLVGKLEEAKILGEKLMQIDPLTPMNRALIGLINFFEGRMALTIDRCAEWLRLEAQNPAALYWYSAALVYDGRKKDALTIVADYINKEWDDIYTKLCLFIKYTAENNSNRIRKIVTGDFELKLKRSTQNIFFSAMYFALAGMNDEALKWLEHAVDRGFCNYPFILTQRPVWDEIRGEERFKKLMTRMKYEWEHFDD